MFDIKEAMAISRIPISRLGSPDVLVWHNDKGVYTVKIGYKMLCKEVRKQSRGNSQGKLDACVEASFAKENIDFCLETIT